RLYLVQQPVEVREGGRAELVGHGARAAGVGVEHPDEAGFGQLREMPRVVPAQGADAHHADGQGRAHAGTPRSELSTNARKRSTSGDAGRSFPARWSPIELSPYSSIGLPTAFT